MNDKVYLAAAAKAAAEQLADNAALHVPLDPDVGTDMVIYNSSSSEKCMDLRCAAP